MEKRDVEAYIVTTKIFVPLVEAQAKARKVTPHVIVVKHPIGGLNDEELVERIETAAAGLEAKIAD